MRRLPALLVVAAFLAAGAASSGGAGSAPVERAEGHAPKPSPLLAIVCADCGGEAILGRFDRLSLAAHGRTLPLRGFSSFPTLSPDKRTLAVAHANGSVLRFVDLRRLRFAGRIELRGTLSALAWLEPDRLVAVATTGAPGDLDVLLLEPPKRRARRVASIPGPVWIAHPVAQTRRQLVLALGHPLTVALEPTEVAVIDGMGHVRTVTLEEIRSGLLEQGQIETLAQPGLAADPEAERAFVAGGAAPVAEIDLGTMDVRYHEPRESASLLGRLRDWLEPAAQAKGPTRGPFRQALWLGNDTLAVFGWDNDATVSASGTLTTRSTPAGLKLIDTRTWTSKTVDQAATGVQLAGDNVLAWSGAPAPAQTQVTVFGRDGSQRHRLLDGRRIWELQPAGRYAYLRTRRGAPLQVIDLKSGRVIRTLNHPGLPQPITILSP